MENVRRGWGRGAVRRLGGYREYLESVIFSPWAERLVNFVGLGAGRSRVAAHARVFGDETRPTGRVRGRRALPAGTAVRPGQTRRGTRDVPRAASSQQGRLAVWLSSPRVEPLIVYGEALRAHHGSRRHGDESRHDRHPRATYAPLADRPSVPALPPRRASRPTRPRRRLEVECLRRHLVCTTPSWVHFSWSNLPLPE